LLISKDSLDNLIKEKIPEFSGTLLISIDSRIVYENIFGYRDYQKKISNKIETQFLLGSITKQFTAAAIMTLYENGKISPQEYISRYLTDLPDKWKTITVHELLTHTSGLMHSWDLENFETILNGSNQYSLPEILKLYYDKPMSNNKGVFHYSGLGYFILAAIIEKITGQGFNTYLNDELFKRLQMTATVGYDYSKKYPDLAIGYNTVNDSLDSSIGSFLYGGGNVMSNSIDLYKWDNSFYDHKVLQPKTESMIFTPYVKVNETSFYGYGWYFIKRSNYSLIMHGGSVPAGFRAYIIRVPEKRLFIALLSNRPDGKMRELSFEITDYLHKNIN